MPGRGKAALVKYAQELVFSVIRPASSENTFKDIKTLALSKLKWSGIIINTQP